MLRKDMIWSVNEDTYRVQNVPYEIIDGEEVLDLDTSMKLAALRELMIAGKMRHIMDFLDFKDIVW